MQYSLLLLLFSFHLTAIAQQRVFFSDSLEERSEVNIIKDPVQYEDAPGRESFTKMKMVDRPMKNFNYSAEYLENPKTRTPAEKLKVPLYLVRFAMDGTIASSEPLTVNANYDATGHFSYQLIGPDTHQANITGITHSTYASWEMNVGSFSVSKTKPDTTYLNAEITTTDQKAPCTIEAVFQGDGPNSIGAIALYEGDTIFIRTTNKAKKYHALGVELSLHNKIIAGMQLPDMHIGPSYSVVDKTLPAELKNMAYAILSVILYTNENRPKDF